VDVPELNPDVQQILQACMEGQCCYTKMDILWNRLEDVATRLIEEELVYLQHTRGDEVLRITEKGSEYYTGLIEKANRRAAQAGQQDLLEMGSSR